MAIVEIEKLEDNKKENDINQRFINEEKFESKIPVAASKASSIPVKKVKTIKKHSKVRRDLNVQDVVQHRPNVGDIEWGEEKRDTEREVEDIDDDEEEVEDDDELDIDPNDVIKEISTLALEDVQQLSSLDQSDPIVLISSGDDDYSGDIDEFILIEAPNNYTQARQMQKRHQLQQQQLEQEQAYHENKTISTTTMREFDAEGRETVTIRREEHGPDGEVIITEETHDSNDYPPTHESHTNNSESDTDDQLSPVDEINEHMLGHSKHTENFREQSKMLGSSSGSDVALHEPGAAESSEDETGTVLVFV